MNLAKHNTGKCQTDLNVIEGYFKGYCARFEYPEAFTYIDEDNGTIALYMKKEEPFLLITENHIIGELTESEADLLNQ